MSQKWCVQQHVEDNFVCSICQSLMTNPYRPKNCKHSFCKGCLTQVHDRSCPMCRQPFGLQDIVPDDRLRNNIQNWNYKCDMCSDQVRVADYETHSNYCSSDTASLSSRSLQSVHSTRSAPRSSGAGAAAAATTSKGAGAGTGATGIQKSRSNASIASTLRGSAATASNRYTFRCPYCAVSNLDAQDLIAHCNQSHQNDEKNKICPICVAMPWGNPNQHSVDFITHLNLRHKFEYDKFVNFDLNDQEMLAEAMRNSLRVY